MTWVKKNWKLLLFGGIGAGVVAFLIIWFVVLAGNADSDVDPTKVKKGELAELKGHFESSNNPKKAEIFFINKATKEARGKFKKFKAVLDIDGSLESAKLKVTIQVGSLDTENGGRDEHLMQSDFFNESKYPEITFVSDKIEKVEGTTYKATGKLNFVGKEWDFSFKFTYRGSDEQDGKLLASFKGEFGFKQGDYGMNPDGVADNTLMSFYVDMIQGGDSEGSEGDEEEEDDEEEEEGPAGPALDKPYDDELNQVEEEAAAL